MVSSPPRLMSEEAGPGASPAESGSVHSAPAPSSGGFPEMREPDAAGHHHLVHALDSGLAGAVVDLAGGDRLNVEAVLLTAVLVWAKRYCGEAGGRMAVRSADLAADQPAVLLDLPLDGSATFRSLLPTLRVALLDALVGQYPTPAADDPVAVTVDLTGGDPEDMKVSGSADVVVTAVLDLASRKIALGLAFDQSRRSKVFMGGALSALVRTLGALVADSGARIDGLMLLPDEEARSLTGPFQGRAVDRPARKLIDVIQAQAATTPDRIAVRTGGEALTYSEFNRRANRLAHTLRAGGVGPDVRVGVVAERGIEMLVGIYAILKAGGAYVPVDPGYPSERISFILQDCAAAVVLTCRAPSLDVGPARRIDLEDELAYAAADHDPAPAGGPADLAYLIYTSGSTGRPKGVMIENHSVLNRLEWMQAAYPLSGDDVILQKTSIAFDVSVWELFWWAFSGASVCLLGPGEEKDPGAILRAVAGSGVTVMHFVPSMLDAFLSFLEAEGPGGGVGGLRTVFASGEALTPSQAGRFGALLGRDGGPHLVNLYGPTEATVDVTHFPVEDFDSPSVPIGRPIDNTEIYILGPDRRLQPIGAAGELVIAGRNVARGYHDRAELDAERFVRVDIPELGAGRRVYRTGDLARWRPDGNIEYLGRLDDQIKIRGYRIETGEIEDRLRRIDGVADARVIGIFEPGRQPYLCAYVITPGGADSGALSQALRAFLPDFMIPAHFIQVDRFPLTPNGKLDRKALPRPGAGADPADCTPPRTEAERQLLAIWKEVLNTDAIGIDTDFFSAGGDSISAIRVLSRCKQVGLEVEFAKLFRHPTVRALAPEAVPASAPAPAYRPFSLLAAADRERLPEGLEDAYPLSALQAGLLFQGEVSKGAAWYHDVLSYTFSGAFDADAFAKAADIVVRDNPIFRTSYHLTEYSEMLQCVHRTAPSPLTVVDWRAHAAAEQDALYLEFVRAEQARAFDWGRADLIRIFVHVLSDQAYRYTLSFHDSTLDGWSINRVQLELFTHYFAILGGGGPAPAAKTNYFAEYIRQERALLADDAPRTYWTERLSDREFAEVPRLRPATSDVSLVRIRDVDIAAELSEAVKALARRHKVPVKTVLLAAHMRVLSTLVGQAEVVSGYEHSGRPEELDAELTMGLFLNTVPFRLNADAPSWTALIRSGFEAEADFLPFRRYPMSAMKRDLRTTDPLFEVVFNFTHFHLLKPLQGYEGFDLLDVRVRSETEFVLRAEFSQHYYTDEVRLSLHYHANLFDEDHIDRIGGYYRRALELMTADDASSPGAVPLLSPAELDRVANRFNDSDNDQDFDRLTHRYFEDQVRLAPARTALRCQDTVWSYGELNRRSNLMAHSLAALALPPESSVAVYTGRHPAWAAAMLGLFKAGQVYVPVEPDFPADRAAQLIGQSDCRAAITERVHADRLRGVLESAGIGCPVLICEEVLASEESLPDLAEDFDSARLAYVFFTSGSTGVPKGAALEHRGMVNHLFAKIHDFSIAEGDVVAQNSPLGFDISVWQLVSGLMVGAEVAIYDKDQVLDAVGLLERLSADRVAVFETVPSYFGVMLDALETKRVDLCAMRHLVLNAEVLKPSDVARWFALYPQNRLVNAYGATECSDDVTHYHLAGPDTGRIPVGRPLQNMKVHVLDRDGQYAPLGTPGEIFCTGVGVGRGYLNLPEANARAFLHDARGAVHGRMYRTGDFGCWAVDGNLHFLGRRDEQVKIRGFRIELDEIENTLVSYPAVSAAAVVVREGADGRDLVAFVVPADASPVALAAHLADRLPDYMVPSAIVPVEALPLSDNGKVNRKRLRALAAGLDRGGDSEVEPVRTDGEAFLRDLWATVLGVEPARVGRTSDFFQLGGSSLTAMISAMRSGGRYKVNDLFRHRTIEALAAAIAAPAGPAPLLHDLSPAASEASDHVLLCFPYAGGGAFNFQAFADAVAAIRPGYRLLGVEYPRSGSPGGIEGLAAELLAGLDPGSGRLSVLGHCSGTAPALAFARAAERAGRAVDTVFLCGKVLRPPAVLSAHIEEAGGMTAGDIIEWLTRVSGLTGLEQLSPAMAETLAENFRWDTVEANRILLSIGEGRDECRLKAPVVHVLSADDPTTRDEEHLSDRWSMVAGTLSSVRLDGGGHYFFATRPRAAAEAVVAAIEKAPADPATVAVPAQEAAQ